MSIETTQPTCDVDTQAVMDHVLHGKPISPEVYRRIREQAAEITEQIRQRHGTLNIAVDLIRAIRDEE